VPRRKPGLELVDARNGLRHLVSPEAILETRHRGTCPALCGARVFAASFTDPGRGWCRLCAQTVSGVPGGGR
jgi:hypothetical protein